MKTIKVTLLSTLLLLALSFHSQAQYNKCAAQNVITESVEDENGEIVERRVNSDQYGNAQGNQYDLAVDGAFEGETIAVLHLYTSEGFDFELPKKALAEKGFSTYRWMNKPPSPQELKEGLEKACQLWIISNSTRMLTEEHLAVIKEFFDSGKGLYIWGDNLPYYADANYVSEALFGTSMNGNLMGNETVKIQQKSGKAGLRPNHLITTGLEYVYEGITIATIQKSKDMKPLIHGSADNLVAAIYEKDGKRAIIDGGFTRLYVNWDTAGTGRYVKNAAAWLVNYERFGEANLNQN